MAHGAHALRPGRGWIQSRLRALPRRTVVVLAVIGGIAIVSGFILASGSPAKTPQRHGPAAAQLRQPTADLVLTGSPVVVAVDVVRELFSTAPVVVLADGNKSADVEAAANAAQRKSAPLLLASTPTGSLPAAVQAEIKALHPRAVLAVGIAPATISAQLSRISVVTKVSALPPTAAPKPLRRVAMLMHRGRRSAAMVAAAVTAQSAGVAVIATPSDPRTYPSAITALARIRPDCVLALGAGFGPARVLAANVALAETGIQLPGGGQILFPGHRLVALYGHPGMPALGALGEQGLTASVARIRQLAALYRPLSRVPVVPTFEIIATVAEGSPGPNGLYSYETPVATLRPWVRRAAAAGLYVVLDLQPGRANLLAQAKLYESLLRLPDVGLALDPEWKLQPHQLPLRQIGSVSIAEVNSVVNWLAALTARYHLPQKLLVLHQFRLSMIQGEAGLDTHHSDLAIVIHMDGQGSPSAKIQTWNAVTAAAPKGVFFGWKNFFVKDHPMMDPQETMARTPQPVMISYQ